MMQSCAILLCATAKRQASQLGHGPSSSLRRATKPASSMSSIQAGIASTPSKSTPIRHFFSIIVASQRIPHREQICAAALCCAAPQVSLKRWVQTQKSVRKPSFRQILSWSSRVGLIWFCLIFVQLLAPQNFALAHFLLDRMEASKFCAAHLKDSVWKWNGINQSRRRKSQMMCACHSGASYREKRALVVCDACAGYGRATGVGRESFCEQTSSTSFD